MPHNLLAQCFGTGEAVTPAHQRARDEQKRCRTCLAMKPLDRFDCKPDGKFGRNPHCKNCRYLAYRIRRGKYYEDIRRKERERDKKRWADPATVAKRDKLKYQSRAILHAALRSGRIVKLPRCEKCGCNSRLHGHHHDYAKPLEVTWLCIQCHVEVHRVA